MIEIITAADYVAALTAQVSAARSSIIASLYMARPAYEGDSPSYRALWHALAAAPGHTAERKMILNRTTPSNGEGLYNTAAAEQLAAAGWQIRHPPPPTIAHEKVWIFDTRHVLIGSSNLAAGQHRRTTNINLLIDNRELAKRLLSIWRKQWTNTPAKPPRFQHEAYP